MRLSHASASALTSATPLLAVLVPEGGGAALPGGELGARGAALIARKVFTGTRFKTLMVHADGRKGPRALLLVGVGKPAELCGETWRRAGALVVAGASEIKAGALVVGAAEGLAFDADAVQAFGEGAVLGGYRYAQRPVSSPPPRQVRVVCGGRGAKEALEVAQALGEAVNLARDLGDLPGNVATPRHLANTARKVAREGRLRCRVHGKAALKRMGMGGILAVNQGSAQEPFLIELDYRGAGARRTIAVVGKGLTFDSGGISIKPAANMEDMKYDMCGAAAVLGLMRALALLRPRGIAVRGIIGTTENMPGPAAYKPGDVVKTASGKTIEVINTDAEGRVVLADALHHAAKGAPDAIIDLATLTGAIVVGLGHEAAGLFCRDESLSRRLMDASTRTGERLWPMPTFPEYAELIKSRVADVKNSAGRGAGSCTAAQFLFAFSGEVPHAHIDIAGTAWDGRKRDYHVEGASGFGVRLLYEAVSAWSK